MHAQGVKANVLFLEEKGASKTRWTKQLWIYDLRTNKHCTLKTNPLRRDDLNEFVEPYGGTALGSHEGERLQADGVSDPNCAE